MIASVDINDNEIFDLDAQSNKEDEVSLKSIQESVEEIETKPVLEYEKSYRSPIAAYIIVGSFSSEKNANRFLAKLKEQGYSNTVILDKSKSKYHRVSINGFVSVEIAEKELKKIKKDFNSAWITEDF